MRLFVSFLRYLCSKLLNGCQRDGSQKDRETKGEVHQSIRVPSGKEKGMESTRT